MNRAYHPNSKLTRSIFGLAAVIATALITVSIDGLARHYSNDSAPAQDASVSRIAVVMR
ncbi:MAG TPA: hypothetical protein VF229_04145 [Burkholderiaceae bacterium]